MVRVDCERRAQLLRLLLVLEVHLPLGIDELPEDLDGLLPFLDERLGFLLRYAFPIGFLTDLLHVAPLLGDLVTDARRFRDASACQLSFRLLESDRPASLRAACTLVLRGRPGHWVRRALALSLLAGLGPLPCRWCWGSARLPCILAGLGLLFLLFPGHLQ
eukprot:7675014-Heterocapsa_arctica.AAC.1